MKGFLVSYFLNFVCLKTAFHLSLWTQNRKWQSFSLSPLKILSIIFWFLLLLMSNLSVTPLKIIFLSSLSALRYSLCLWHSGISLWWTYASCLESWGFLDSVSWCLSSVLKIFSPISFDIASSPFSFLFIVGL